jgi:hypothetical protein
VWKPFWDQTLLLQQQMFRTFPRGEDIKHFLETVAQTQQVVEGRFYPTDFYKVLLGSNIKLLDTSKVTFVSVLKDKNRKLQDPSLDVLYPFLLGTWIKRKYQELEGKARVVSAPGQERLYHRFFTVYLFEPFVQMLRFTHQLWSVWQPHFEKMIRRIEQYGRNYQTFLTNLNELFEMYKGSPYFDFTKNETQKEKLNVLIRIRDEMEPRKDKKVELLDETKKQNVVFAPYVLLDDVQRSASIIMSLLISLLQNVLVEKPNLSKFSPSRYTNDLIKVTKNRIFSQGMETYPFQIQYQEFIRALSKSAAWTYLRRRLSPQPFLETYFSV